MAAREHLLVVGVMGARAAGKSYAAEHLRRTRGAAVLSFADPLKDAVIALFGFTADQVYGDAAAKERVDAAWGVSPREVLAVIGTDLVRGHLSQKLPATSGLLVRRLEQRIDAIAAADDNAAAAERRIVVVPDLRFEDELDLVQRMGGVLWRVERAGGSTASPRHAAHASERLAADTSQDARRGVVRVVNDGTPEGFGAAIDAAIDAAMTTRHASSSAAAVAAPSSSAPAPRLRVLPRCCASIDVRV